jgi:FAD/FMN-containing dehydrogenase
MAMLDLGSSRLEQKLKEPTKTSLSGWGRYPSVETVLLKPDSIPALAECLAPQRTTTTIARGLGRSYGDAAINGSGDTVSVERLNRILAVDYETGHVVCEPGVTIEDLIVKFLPAGWFPLVVPGTKFVTVAGAIASDIHGKNHHRNGSFVNCIVSFQLITANGTNIFCSREENATLFWATVGGMGLTGFISQIEMKLERVESAYINQKTIKTRDLDETLEAFERLEPGYQYSVAWIDCLAKKQKLGRGIVIFGNSAEMNELNQKQYRQPFQVSNAFELSVDFEVPSYLMNKVSIGAFNEIFWSSHFGKEKECIVPYNRFFFPLDRVHSWNRLYGKKGFVQYQCVMPFDGGRENLIKMLEITARYGMSSFLCVLKRLGPEQGLLSFPKPGYTITFDMPVKPGLFDLIAEFDALLMQSDGRVYLAKDSYLNAQQFQRMYPKWDLWMDIKQKIDPSGILRSTLSDRLGLTGL